MAGRQLHLDHCEWNDNQSVSRFPITPKLDQDDSRDGSKSASMSMQMRTAMVKRRRGIALAKLARRISCATAILCITLVVIVWIRSRLMLDFAGFAIPSGQVSERTIGIISAPDGLAFGTEYVYVTEQDPGFYYVAKTPTLPHTIERQWVPIRVNSWRDSYSNGFELIIHHWLVVSALAMLLVIPMLGRWRRRTSRRKTMKR